MYRHFTQPPCLLATGDTVRAGGRRLATIERLGPRPELVARAIGIAVIAAGAIAAFG